MMKIHTTQNLNVAKTILESTNFISSPDFRFNNYSNIDNDPGYDSFEKNISFTGKKPPRKLFNKIVGQSKEKAEKIIKTNKDILEGNTKNPLDGRLNRFLETTTKQEVFINALVSAVLAGIMRPVTLMIMADDNSRKNMAYASGHAISSAAWGLIVPFIFIRPFAAGYNKVAKNMHKYLKPEEIKEIYPWLDITNPENYIINEKGEKVLRQLVSGKDPKTKEWVRGCYDVMGNDFMTDIKDVYKVALPKHSTEISKETYSKFFDDKGNAKTLKDVYICLVSPEKAEKLAQERTFWDKLFNRQVKPKYYELDQCTDEIWLEAFPNLDPATIGKVGARDVSKMRNLDGSAFKLDSQFLYISDFTETNKVIPYSTGLTFPHMKKSLFTKGKIKQKDVCYQKNGKDFGKGTPIDADMVNASGMVEVLNKAGGWFPDLIIAYPRAAATIALIPFVLKKVFHLEKVKPTPKPAVETGKESA